MMTRCTPSAVPSSAHVFESLDARLELHWVVRCLVKSHAEDVLVRPVPVIRELSDACNRAGAAGVLVAVAVYVQLQGMRVVRHILT